MKQFVLIAVLLAVVFVPMVQAADIGPDGLEVLDVRAYEPSLWERIFGDKALAILADKGYYSPGDTAVITIGSLVECNTKYAYLVIEGQGGTRMYSTSVSGLITPCSTSYVKVTVKVPNTAGVYTVAVDFRDGINQLIYRDATVLTVKDPAVPVQCPAAYCTPWTNGQKVENGIIQVKTCYSYAASTCASTAKQEYRTVCSSGFVLEGGKCIKPESSVTNSNPVAICGDNVKQSGEECDYGFDNGACPATCSNTCVLSKCENLPTISDPSVVPDSGSNGNAALLLFGSGLVLTLGGAVWMFFKRR